MYITIGQIESLKSQLRKDYKKIIALVPHPSLFKEMQQLAEDYRHLQWQAASVTIDSSAATLNVTNLASLSSQHLPTGIKNLYPNLKIIKNLPVEHVTVEELLKQAELTQEENNTLYLETNGQEEEIFKQLIDQRKLHLFSEIQVRVGEEPLYDKSSTSKKIIQLLQKQAYLFQTQKQVDPEHLFLTFNLNKNLHETKKLLAKVEADTKELRERYSEKVRSEQELKKLIQELQLKLQAALDFYQKLEQDYPQLLQKL